MKFSLVVSPRTPWPQLLDECHHAEATGWDTIWMPDHFMPDGEANLGPMQEVWTCLSAIAASVPRVRLGTMVVGNTYRNPAVLAKEAAQVDIISGGRLILGLGAGWQENEHTAYDIPFYTVGGRLARLEESIQIVRSLFETERTNFDGKFYKIRNAPLVPKPVQQHMEILVGGAGEKVTLRITAQYADAWNTFGPPDSYAHKAKVLEEHCERLGRDPATVRRTVAATIGFDEGGSAEVRGSVDQMCEQLAAYEALHVDEFIAQVFGVPIESRRETFDRFIHDVVPAFGSR